MWLSPFAPSSPFSPPCVPLQCEFSPKPAWLGSSMAQGSSVASLGLQPKFLAGLIIIWPHSPASPPSLLHVLHVFKSNSSWRWSMGCPLCNAPFLYTIHIHLCRRCMCPIKDSSQLVKSTGCRVWLLSSVWHLPCHVLVWPWTSNSSSTYLVRGIIRIKWANIYKVFRTVVGTYYMLYKLFIKLYQ